MNKQLVIDHINVISTSNDKNVIYQSLLKLRTDLVKDKEGIQLFYNCEGIPPLVRLISKPYEKILEVALSILGNCCTIKYCCKQAISIGVVPPTLTILKSIPNPSVQCKVCRLIGNLARESNEKICNLAKGIGVAIAEVLDDNKDIPTLNMAIRSVRLLWNEMPFYDEFIRSDGVKKIIKILVKHTKVEHKLKAKSIVETYPEEKERVDYMENHIPFMECVNSKAFDREIIKKSKPITDSFKIPESKMEIELFSEIFRCLQTVTIGHSLRVIYDFYVDEHGCNAVVFFAKSDSPFRAQALKILSNLSSCQNSTEFLCSADAITTACYLITSQNLEPPLTESEERHCVNIICFLAGDACNRAKIRMSGAFKRIIEIAKNTKCNNVLSTILIGLQSFKYDNISIDLMIKMGLVSVLVDRLDINTKDLTENHTKKISKRLTCEEDKDCTEDEIMKDTRPKRMKVDYIPFSFIPTSPSSSALNYSYPNSPCSSSSLSPRNTPPRNNETNEDKDSEYSPVCSDIEDINEDDDLEQKNIKIIDKTNANTTKLLDDCTRVENELENPLHSEEEDTEDDKENYSFDIIQKKKTVQLIISMLCCVSYRIKHATDLCTPDALNTLIRTCRVAFQRSRLNSRWDEQGAPLVLSHIVSESINFVPIIKQDFIFKIYDMTQFENDHQDCITCNDIELVGRGLLNLLKDMGETGYGRGEMAHLLLKGEKKLHQQVAVVTTYIISNPRILHKLLVECGALYTIMEIILTKGDDLCNAAASGLTALSKELNITVPKYDKSKIDLGMKYCESKSITEENIPIVTFIAGKPDEGQARIVFSEELLKSYSDVFSLMLNSDFRESKEREIVLKNQTVSGIKYLLDSIKQKSQSDLLHVPDHTLIDAVLETYDMCQIYLLVELEKDIFNMILYMLNEKTVLKIFEFAIVNLKQDLSEISINYYLNTNVLGHVKVDMYREADNSNKFKEWNQMMLDTVVYTCQNLIT